MGDGICNVVDVEKNISLNLTTETNANSLTREESPSTLSCDNASDVSQNEQTNLEEFCEASKSGGFEILRSLGCDSSYFCGEATKSTQNDVEEISTNLIFGKRNRQDSCNSTVNDATRKANKKSRKKHAKKQEFDDEIEKILANIEMSEKRVSQSDSTEMEDLLTENKIKSTENIVQGEKNPKSKKKKKKKSPESLATENIEPPNEIIDSENFSVPTGVKKKDKSGKLGVSKLHSDAHKVPDKVRCDTPGEGDVSATTKDRKRPGKKQIAAIHAALQKAKEEEERLLQEELARQKRAEEIERLRLEKIRLEEEKKMKKKQKEKEKKERLKAEGKLLTKAQKQTRARTEAAILAWRQQGIDIPNIGEKKTGLETKNNNRRKHNSSKSSNTDEEHPSSPVDVVSSQESLNTERPLENGSDPSGLHCDKKSFRSSRHTSVSESEVSGADLSGHSHSDLSLHVTSSDTVRNGVLQKSHFMPCIKERLKGKDCKLDSKAQNGKYVSKYRSPVVCVLGHVDTGKTKILDHIRKTHIQASEAGGITQQIGATMVPRDALKEKCGMVKAFVDFQLELPGLLIIDTPGHESFRNLRSRGSSLCDIAILVVDIMHGLEQQTLESLDLLKQKKTPFVVALNKIDRLYGWEPSSQKDIEDAIKSQPESTKMEFERRLKNVILEFANQSLNAALFYDNPDPRSYVSLVPVSAVSGDGMGNVMAIVCQLTQNMMAKKLLFSNELEATVLEVKTTAGLGTTIDVILVNGYLREGDTIVLAGQDGPIVSQVRSLLMPQPLKELRVKSPYVEYKEVKGAQGVKVSGRDLDKVVAGLPLHVARSSDEVHVLKDKVTSLLRSAMSSIHLSERGVYVQASTLGSLEALLDFLRSSEIPYSGVKVGPVVKKDVIKASVMLEHDVQFAVILAFDVKIEKDAQELAENLGIKIFNADIIYHLFDNFMDYREKLLEKRKNDVKKLAVFPCKLQILPECIFNVRDPIVLGVHVEAGILKVGTPICVPSKNALFLGCVANIESQNQSVEFAKAGDEVCVRIEPAGDENPKTYGKQFDHEDILVSQISRQTIDACKEFFRKEFTKSDWQLIVELKKLLHIT